MRELWLQTWELFRRRPVLWLPVVCADLVVQTGRQLWLIIPGTLVAWSMQRTSVLGGTIYRPQPIWLVPVLGLLRFGQEWVGACVYVIAALVIARMVRQILTDEKTESSLARLSLSIGWLALLTLALVGLLAACSFSLVYGFGHHFGDILSKRINLILALPAYLVAAYVVTPQVVKLIGRDQHRPITSEMLGISRRLGPTTAVFAIVLSLPMDALKLPWPHPLGEVVLFSYLRSLIEALPFILVFIAMGLLVCESVADEPDAEAPIPERADSGA